MARPRRVGLGAGPSDATLARRIAWTSHIRSDNGGSGISQMLLGVLDKLLMRTQRHVSLGVILRHVNHGLAWRGRWIEARHIRG